MLPLLRVIQHWVVEVLSHQFLHNSTEYRRDRDWPKISPLFVTFVYDLGVTLENTFSFSAHISNLSRSGFYHLRRHRRRPLGQPGHIPWLKKYLRATVITFEEPIVTSSAYVQSDDLFLRLSLYPLLMSLFAQGLTIVAPSSLDSQNPLRATSICT